MLPLTEKFENKHKGIFQKNGIGENRIRDIEMALFTEKEYLMKLDKASLQSLTRGIFDIKDILEIVFLSLCESQRYRIFNEYFLHTDSQEVFFQSKPLLNRLPGLYEDEILEELSQRLSRVEMVKKQFVCRAVPLGFSYSHSVPNNMEILSLVKDTIIQSIARENALRRDTTGITVARRLCTSVSNQFIPVKRVEEIEFGKFSKILVGKSLSNEILSQLQSLKNWIPGNEYGGRISLKGTIKGCEIYETNLPLQGGTISPKEIIAIKKDVFPALVFGTWLELSGPPVNTTYHNPVRLEDYQVFGDGDSVRLYGLIN